MLETRGETDRSVRGTQAAADEPASLRRRPFGVNAIIVLLIVNFTASVMAAVGLPFAWSMLPQDLQRDVVLIVAISIVQSIASLILVFGLWRMRRWAWYGTMILTGVSLAIAIWQYFRGPPAYDDLFLNALIAFYLNQRDVQGRFSKDPTKAAPQ